MNLKSLNKLEQRVIGHIGVDSGMVWIGDPCYIIHRKKTPLELGTSWAEFCTLISKPHNSFNYEAGHEGFGICTRTPYGDGYYKITGFFEKNTPVPSFIMIDFEGEMDFLDNEDYEY